LIVAALSRQGAGYGRVAPSCESGEANEHVRVWGLSKVSPYPGLSKVSPYPYLPVDIARAVGFLASDAASAITGVALPVDCGLTSGNIVMRGELTLEDL